MPMPVNSALNLAGDALTPGAQRSWWLREALAREPGSDCPPLDKDVNADVVIIGGGFTGLWTAFFLTEANPNLGIAVLEQDICGGGPSGRNGGVAGGGGGEVDRGGGLSWARTGGGAPPAAPPRNTTVRGVLSTQSGAARGWE